MPTNELNSSEGKNKRDLIEKKSSEIVETLLGECHNLYKKGSNNCVVTDPVLRRLRLLHNNLEQQFKEKGGIGKDERGV